MPKFDIWMCPSPRLTYGIRLYGTEENKKNKFQKKLKVWKFEKSYLEGDEFGKDTKKKWSEKKLAGKIRNLISGS